MPSPTFHIDVRLKEWATERQVVYIDAITKHKSVRAAARALGIHKSSIDSGIASVRNRAAIAGYSPQHDMTRTVPAPFKVKGVSTYYDKEGKASGQWVKSQLDDDAREQIIREFVKNAAQGEHIVVEYQPMLPLRGATKLVEIIMILFL